MTQYVIENRRADQQVISINHGWNHLCKSFLEKFGDTEENLKWFNENTKLLQSSQSVAVFNAETFIAYYEQYVIKKKEIPLPVMFKMHDLIAGFRRAAPALSDAAMNVPGPGSDDDRWLYTMLPFDELLADPTKRIPIRAETHSELIYGFYELFTYEEKDEASGEIRKIITEFPAIRVSSNYLQPNAVWRWFRVTEKSVKEHWKLQQSRVIKKVKKPKNK